MRVVIQMKVTDNMASDNEKRRSNNIDGLQKRHKKKLEFEGRKHNFISRNFAGSKMFTLMKLKVRR